MITKIGIVAGEILSLLEEADQPMNVAVFPSRLDAPTEIVLMSIGWLAREGYVHMAEKDGKLFIFRSVEYHAVS